MTAAAPSPRRLPKRNVALVVTPALIVLLLVVAVTVSVIFQNQSRDRVGRARLVLISAGRVLSTLKDAETGQRGYLLTGSDAYLQPYRVALDSFHIESAQLRALTADDAAQQRQLDTMSRLAEVKLAQLERTIALRRAGQLTQAMSIVSMDTGRVAMDGIRRILGQIQDEEWRLHSNSLSAERSSSRFTLWLLVVGGLGTVAASYYLTRVLARHGRDLEAQTLEMEAQRNELELINVRLRERTVEAEEAGKVAREASDAKSRFLATMSHELRTPLNAIIGYTDLIDSGLVDPGANTEKSYVQRARRAARHLLSLIDDVLTISRSEVIKDTTPLDAVRVGDLLQDVISVISPLAQQKRLGFEVHCDVDGQRVMIDRRRVRQILINILGNAVKFTKDGKVDLVVNCDQNKLMFTVRDTGPGIDSEHAERIFEPFWQAPYKHRGDRPAGVGLGLSVSRQLARAMNGDLTVARANGAGSEFTLTLPFTSPA